MDSNRIHERVMELVEESGKSVRQVEREAGISNGIIGQLPRKKNPSIVCIKKLADYFGKPVDYFVA